MIHAATRLVRLYLETHPTASVAQLLPAVPLEPGHATPAVPAIYDDHTDQTVAKDLDPPHTPALVVFADNDGQVEIKNASRGASTVVLADRVLVYVAYIDRDREPLDSTRDGSYTLRAVRRAVFRMAQEEAASTWRNLLDYRALQLRELTESRVRGAVGQSTMYGFVTAGLLVMDRAPT